jgi:hypothetical protein
MFHIFYRKINIAYTITNKEESHTQKKKHQIPSYTVVHRRLQCDGAACWSVLVSTRRLLSRWYIDSAP